MIDLTPLDVRNKRGDFKKLMRGYDPQEVDVFLELIAERLEALVRENLQLKERTGTLQIQVNSQMGREQAVQDALVTAQELRADIKAQSQREAEHILKEAETEARRVIGEAEAQVRGKVRGVERRIDGASDVLTELERRRTRFLKEFRQLLERELDVVEVEEDRTPLEERTIDLDLGPVTASLGAVSRPPRGDVEPDGEARAASESGSDADTAQMEGPTEPAATPEAASEPEVAEVAAPPEYAETVRDEPVAPSSGTVHDESTGAHPPLAAHDMPSKSDMPADPESAATDGSTAPHESTPGRTAFESEPPAQYESTPAYASPVAYESTSAQPPQAPDPIADSDVSASGDEAAGPSGAQGATGELDGLTVPAEFAADPVPSALETPSFTTSEPRAGAGSPPDDSATMGDLSASMEAEALAEARSQVVEVTGADGDALADVPRLEEVLAEAGADFGDTPAEPVSSAPQTAEEIAPPRVSQRPEDALLLYLDPDEPNA